MDNLTQKDPVWRENGKAFVESVTRLLERLLDYRNVGQVRYEISDSKSQKYVVFITEILQRTQNWVTATELAS